MQDYPGAPGSARPGNPGTTVPAACGGAAAQPLPKAPDHHRSSAAPMPKAPGHIRPCAASMPMAPGHIRPRAASMPKALGHNRPRAASMASPGHADASCGPASAGRRVPLTTAPVPAHASRLLRIVLLRVAATPRTLTDPLSHRLKRHSHESGNPHPPCYGGITGGLHTGNPRCVFRNSHRRAPRHPTPLPTKRILPPCRPAHSAFPPRARGPGGRSRAPPPPPT